MVNKSRPKCKTCGSSMAPVKVTRRGRHGTVKDFRIPGLYACPQGCRVARRSAHRTRALAL